MKELNMKDLRERSGKRPETIASELKVGISTVRNWERLKNAPRMTPIGIAEIMRIYNCTFDELVQADRMRFDSWLAGESDGDRKR